MERLLLNLLVSDSATIEQVRAFPIHRFAFVKSDSLLKARCEHVFSFCPIRSVLPSVEPDGRPRHSPDVFTCSSSLPLCCSRSDLHFTRLLF